MEVEYPQKLYTLKIYFLEWQAVWDDFFRTACRFAVACVATCDPSPEDVPIAAQLRLQTCMATTKSHRIFNRWLWEKRRGSPAG